MWTQAQCPTGGPSSPAASLTRFSLCESRIGFQEFYFWAGHLFDWLPTTNTHKLSIFGRNFTYNLHPNTVCNKTDQLMDKVKHSHWIIQLKIQKLSQLCRYPTKAITQLIVMRSAYILPGSPTIICWEHEYSKNMGVSI